MFVLRTYAPGTANETACQAAQVEGPGQRRPRAASEYRKITGAEGVRAVLSCAVTP